ncbi:MAG: polyphosphate kinase 2 family protein [Bacteroidales bacterium]|nr:polyphosphate kinase 2 family protein [Bacteroidales bacterium]
MKENSNHLNTLSVPPKANFSLQHVDPSDTHDLDDKQEAQKKLEKIREELTELQEILYAQGKYAVLILFQAMDTGGKDGTIRHVFGPLNPQGVRVINFKAPCGTELEHDYLWRIHKEIPRKGMIGIFNRSHYEDVLIARVHNLVPDKEIEKRYAQINAFEKYLAENHVLVLKFMLHISRKEQKDRLEKRLERPDKQWKFDKSDLEERTYWDNYMQAFNRALNECSTQHAPWHVIPANRKWARDFMVGSITLERMKSLDLNYPEPPSGLDKIIIPD